MADISKLKVPVTNGNSVTEQEFDIKDAGARTSLGNLGTAATKDVPTSGNASSTQVVMGNDSRLSDARTPTSHTHTKSQITDFPTLGTAAAKDVPSSGNASTTQVVMGNDSRLSDSRTPTSHTHTKSQITDFPSLGTASAKNSTSAVTQSSTDLVESGAVYTAINTAIGNAVDNLLAASY